MSPAPTAAEHRGVYGLWRQDGLVVAVRKARGPYTGQLDLPGGAPEAGELSTQTLARELQEECGVQLAGHGPWCPFDLHITCTSTGEPIDLRHRGLVAQVTVTGPVSRVEDVEDVAAVELVDPERLPAHELSPLLQHALRVVHLV